MLQLYDHYDPSTYGLAKSFNYLDQKQEKTRQEEAEWKTLPGKPTPMFRDIFSLQTIQKGQGSKLENFKHGTTTLGFVFNGGVILAVDSRASMGSFLSSEQVRKIIEVNEYLLATMAGGAADCQYWLAYLANHCKQYELKNGKKLSVAAASKYLQNIIMSYRGTGLSMGCMLAGTDDKGQYLFYNDNSGLRLAGKIFSVGSGSTYAYGVLDSYYHDGLSVDQAVELGVRAIYHATHRDTGSGGVVRVYHIHKTGWTKVHDGIDCNKLHYQFAKEKGLVGDEDEAPQRLF